MRYKIFAAICLSFSLISSVQADSIERQISVTQISDLRMKLIGSQVYDLVYPAILQAYKDNPYASFSGKKVVHYQERFYIRDGKGELSEVYPAYIIPPQFLTYQKLDRAYSTIEKSDCYKPSKLSAGIYECLANGDYESERQELLNSNNIMFAPRYLDGVKILGNYYSKLPAKHYKQYIDNLIPSAGYSFSRS